MEKEQLKRIFEFLEEKEEHKVPFIFKVKCEIPLTEEDLNIEGDLNLFDSKITSLPEGLEVGGYLDLSYSKITLLPEGLKIGGYLNLFYTKITSLPKGLEVGGSLHLAHCKELTSLPKGLKVGDNLYIYNTPLTKYSDNELREMVKLGFIKGEIHR